MSGTERLAMYHELVRIKCWIKCSFDKRTVFTISAMNS